MADASHLAGLIAELREQAEGIRQGGGGKAIDSQHKKNRLTARERIARLIAAPGVPRVAATRGTCGAGGGCLPGRGDRLLMTEGSGLYVAGPALVKAAIGQVVESEDLGGARMHAAISGTIDFREPDEPACLELLRRLIGMLPHERGCVSFDRPAGRPAAEIAAVFRPLGRGEYDVRELLPCLLDEGPFDEYK